MRFFGKPKLQKIIEIKPIKALLSKPQRAGVPVNHRLKFGFNLSEFTNDTVLIYYHEFDKAFYLSSVINPELLNIRIVKNSQIILHLYTRKYYGQHKAVAFFLHIVVSRKIKMKI